MPRLQSFELVKCCRSARFRTNSIHVLIQSCSVLLCFISNQADENGRDHIICCLSYQPYCHRIGVASNSHHTNGPTNQPTKKASNQTNHLSIYLSNPPPTHTKIVTAHLEQSRFILSGRALIARDAHPHAFNMNEMNTMFKRRNHLNITSHYSCGPISGSWQIVAD